MENVSDDALGDVGPARAAGAVRVGLALGLAALAACLTVAPASAPGAGQPAPQSTLPPPLALHAAGSLGASDLFAALTAPDRNAEIDALRAIRRDLTSADDPRQRDAARDQLDALLELEERRRPDVPAALVMSSLAARIDNAIAGLEQTAHGAPPAASAGWTDFLPPWPPLAAAALVAGVIAVGAALGAGMAASLVGRRRLARALVEAQGACIAAAARLDATADQTVQAGAAADAIVDAAAAAARDATLAAARLAGATIDAEIRLRDCLDAVDLRQANAGELAAECQAMTRNLPALLAGAVEMVESRSLPAVEAAVLQLQGCAADVASGAAALQAGVETIQAAASGQDNLASIVARAEELVAVLPNIAASLSATAADLRQAPQEAEAQDNPQADTLTAAIARAENFVALLPEVTTGLAAAAAQLRRDAQAQAQVLAEAGASVAQAGQAACAAGTRAEACMESLRDQAAEHANTDAALRDAAQQLREEASALAGMARVQSESGQAISNAGAALQAAADAAAAQDGARDVAWQTLAAQTDAALSALPLETARLISAAVLPAGLTALTETAARLRTEGASAAASAASAACAAREASTDVKLALAALPEAADALAGLAAKAGAELSTAAGLVGEAASSLAEESAQREASLAMLAVRTDAALGALPLEAGQLAAAGAALRIDADAVRDAAGVLIETARAPSAAWADCARVAASGIGALCSQLADGVAGLDGIGAGLRADAERVRQDALLSMQAARDAGAAGAGLECTLRAQTERLAGVLAHADQVLLRLEAADGAGHAAAGLAELAQAVENTRATAAKLAERDDAQAAAADRMAQAARELIAASWPGEPQPSLAWLRGLAAQTNSLLTAAGGIAETALRGDARDLPPDVAADGPALLAAIETCISGLRGTATALAIASDTARLAA
jgi:hypothetical protein